MKYFLLLLCSLFFLSCEKAIDEAKEDAVVKIMVSGLWKVTKYIKGDSVVTADFLPYQFQFHADGKVDALKGATVEKTGTWEGNTTNLSITSNFTAATYPLQLLNGTFVITKTSTTFVEATATINGEQRLLRLDK